MWQCVAAISCICACDAKNGALQNCWAENQKTKGNENGKFSMQQFLVAKSKTKSPTGCRQGVWQGVNGYLVCVLTAHDPWEAFVSACC